MHALRDCTKLSDTRQSLCSGGRNGGSDSESAQCAHKDRRHTVLRHAVYPGLKGSVACKDGTGGKHQAGIKYTVPSDSGKWKRGPKMCM